MNEALVTEYVELCEQLAAVELLDGETADPSLCRRLDDLWHGALTDEERSAAEDQLVAKARSWHDARRSAETESSP